jgi:hypothetical protein
MTTFQRYLPRVREPIYSARAISFAQWTWLGFVLGLALLMAGLLIGPRVAPQDQQSTCVGNVYLPGPFGLSLNCDSPELMWLARDPDALLEKDNGRQNRPGFVLAAAVLQDLISRVIPAEGPPRRIGTGFLDPRLIAQSFTRDLPAYLAYIAINVGLLLASFHFWRRLIEPKFGADAVVGTIVAASGLLLVANDVTKAFVWSPHTQMFNILVPLLALYASLRAWNGAILDRRFMLAMGILVGLGATAYPVFAVIAACLAPIAFVSTDRKRATANTLLMLTAGVAPSALWYIFVRATTGSFHNTEVALGEVVWMADAWSKGVGNFLVEWFGMLGAFLQMAARQALPLVALLAWVGLIAAFDQRARAQLPALAPVAAAALYVSAAILGFYTCVGWTVERLAYPVLPPLMAAAAAGAIAVAGVLDRGGRTVLAAGCAALAVGQIVYEIAKNGPWS